MSNYVTLDNFNETSFTVAYNISYIEDKINNIEIPEQQPIDLSDYVTYSYADANYLREHQSLADYVTYAYLADKDYADVQMVENRYDNLYSQLQLKQDTISDLSTIRTGAAAGATAVQPAALNDYYTKSQVDSAIASATPDIDLTGYVTVDEYNQSSYTIAYNISYLENKINNIDTSGTIVDLSDYVTYSYADANYLREHQSLADYVTYAYADANYLREHQSLADYVTYSYLNNRLIDQQNEYTMMAEGLNTQLFDLNSYIESYYVTFGEMASQMDGMANTLDTNVRTLQQQMSSYAPLSTLNDYYTKSQVDAAIASATPTVDLSSYVTAENFNQTSFTIAYAISYLQDEIDSIDTSGSGTSVDLSDYVTYAYADANYLREHQSLANYYTKSEVYSKTEADNKYLTSHQSLSNYYTKSQVDAAIANATPTVDLSSYVTYSYADANYLREHQSLANYVTYSYADANYLREHQSLSNYYTKAQVDAAIPDTSTLATKASVNEIKTSYLGGLKLQTLTQSQYDALQTYDSTTLYIITD